MEREYIYWRTGAGCLVFLLGGLVATLVAGAVAYWTSAHLFILFGIWAAIFFPFFNLSFRADGRR
mgnify:CR=1 FL=1